MSIKSTAVFSNVEVDSARDGRNRYGFRRNTAVTKPSRLPESLPMRCRARHMRSSAQAPIMSLNAHTIGSGGMTVEKMERNNGD